MNKYSICPPIRELERIYDILAKKSGLDKIAKRPIITIQTRGRQKSLGWYWDSKWKSGKKKISEINICAEELDKNPIEILIHEMAHYHNASLDILDCNQHQYHNKHFKSRAGIYGLNVEKMGRHGWGLTSLSPKLKKEIASLNLKKDIFKLYRQKNITFKSPPNIDE